MRTITNEELKGILEKHVKWLRDDPDGERANLYRADLSEANLSGANLSEANLSRASLSGANLSGANLSRASLSGANLSGANLYRASLSGANLYRADLSGANLSEANLYRANLYRANLSEADLYRANLSGANLSGANLSEANLSEANLSRASLSRASLSGAELRRAINIPYIPMICPEKGSFIGFKKGNIFNGSIVNEAIIELMILEDSKRSSATERKCRCDKAKVISITSLDGNQTFEIAFSHYNHNFIYKVGEIVSVNNFDENRFKVCAPGIHFFINRQEAVDYIF